MFIWKLFHKQTILIFKSTPKFKLMLVSYISVSKHVFTNSIIHFLTLFKYCLHIEGLVQCQLYKLTQNGGCVCVGGKHPQSNKGDDN